MPRVELCMHELPFTGIISMIGIADKAEDYS